jgi:hypothetical protein
MRAVSSTYIPLLKELIELVESLWSYKHSAPSGALSQAPSAHQAQPRTEVWRATLMVKAVSGKVDA